MNTAGKIFENIESGVYDVNNEAHGIKVGVSSGATNRADTSLQDGDSGACC